jgi:release factor glutamine methyltransferase
VADRNISGRSLGRVAAGDPGTVVSRLRAAGCFFAEEEAELIASAARTDAELGAMVDRRVAGEPIEHVVGWARFCRLKITVDRGVFVPRKRTEFLVRQAAARVRPGAVVVDLCCGSGAVGAAIHAALGGAAGGGGGVGGGGVVGGGGGAGDGAAGTVQVHAVDVDPVAVRCARVNLAAAGCHVYLGDLYDPLPAELRGQVDLVVANVPYVPTADVALLPAEARVHEPLVALDGGADGLDLLRRVAARAPAWLAPGGCLLIETSDRQARAAASAFAGAGLQRRVVRSAGLGATVVIGTLVTGHS